jgi:hypothetical protein
MKKYSQEQIKKILKKYNYVLVGEYVRSNIPFECKCIKCRIQTILTLDAIRSPKGCKNCNDLEITNTFKKNNCILLDKPNRNYPMKYICSCGNQSKIRWRNFKRGEKCKQCAIIKSKKNNTKRLRVLNSIHNTFEKNGCKLLETNYLNQKTPLKYICSCGQKSFITWKSFKRGHRCEKCAKEKISKRFIPSGRHHSNWNPDRDIVELNKKIRQKIKSSLRRTLRVINKAKTSKMFDILEYSKDELIKHIVNHDNWESIKDTKWELDHCFPIKAFVDYGIYDEKIINRLNNLQPLSKSDNRSKNDKYDKNDFKKWLLINLVSSPYRTPII